jgi:hypothetical protein
MLGLEVGFGPGGIGFEAGVVRIRGGAQLDGLFNVDRNLGGLYGQAGYVAHF